MKLDKLKGLFRAKRIIALALAAAMTVTSLPQTAYAAEAGAPETETAVEVQEEDEQPAEVTEEADNSADENGENAPEAEESVSSTTQAAETKAEEAVDETTDATEAKETTAQEAENQADADAATVTYEIVYDELEEVADEVKTADYSVGNRPFSNGDKPSNGILWSIQIKGSDGSETNLYHCSSSFTYKWQQGGKDIESAPTDAGEYSLVITPVESGIYKDVKAKTISGFVINKAEMELYVDINPITPGTKKEDVKESINTLTVIGGGNSFSYSPKDKDTKLDVTVKVTDPYKTGDNNETSDTYLKKNGDYSAEIKVEFKASAEEKGNYNLPVTATKRLNVADLKATTTKLDSVTGAADAERSDNEENVKVITKTYDGAEVSVPSYAVTVEEVDDLLDKDGKPVLNTDGSAKHNSFKPADSEVSGKWHSAEFRSWTETRVSKNDDGTEKKDEKDEPVYEDVTFCSLTVGGELEDGKNPTEAGTYVYRVTYAGDKEQYASSYADIVVEITPIEVAVAPQAVDGAKFYAGETVKSVLSKITWKLDKEIKAENIWGTSYDSAWKTQPYEPVFAVYKLKDGVAESKALNSTAVLTDEKGVTYEVRFTGKKSAYDEDGDDYNRDINDDTVDSFNSNYKTSTDETKNALTLTLSDSNVKIDVTPITAGLTASSVKIDGNTIYTKVYSEDGALYNSRAEYKKATVASGELTYKWYKWRRDIDVNCADYNVSNGTYDFKSKANWRSLPINDDDFIDNNYKSLKDAGIYKLEITYDDGTAYAQENIYYAIEPQQLRYVPAKVSEARYGADTEDYVAYNIASKDFAPTLQINVGNAGKWEAVEGWTESIDYSFGNIDWYVISQSQKSFDATKENTRDWGRADSFVQEKDAEGKPLEDKQQNKYRIVCDDYNIAIAGEYENPNYTFYKYTAEDVIKSADSKDTAETNKKILVTENLSNADITVKEAGATALGIKLPEKAITAEKVYDGKAITVDLSGVKLVDKKDDKEVSVKPEFVWKWRDEIIVLPEEAINGGEYVIYAYYLGDADYAPMDAEYVATATIKQKELTVSVKPLTEEIIAKAVAGNYAYSIYADYTRNRKAGDMLTVEGLIADDEMAFQWMLLYRDEDGGLKYGYPAWTDIDEDDIYFNQPELAVFGSDKTQYSDYDKLKGGETYTLKFANQYVGALAEPYCYNYEVKAGKSVEIEAAYASSTTALYVYNSNKVTSADNVSESAKGQFAHDITFRESIPYAVAPVQQEDGTWKQVYGSWAEVRIYIPKEFDDNLPAMAAYENALKNAGAIKVDTNNDFYKGNYISAVFNLSKDGENGLEPNPVTFSISWKKNFIETFTVTPTKENLAADLRNAVAPKSVAFNAPKTKMVVGEVQDLDVKITKVQNEDLVYLDYKFADGAPTDILAISSQGRITALKEGTTTVEVYPVKIANNSKVQITGAKTAQVKITVSKVDAPKVGAVIPADESVKVQYPYVKNNGKYYDYGYRREVYVIEGSKKAVTDFDAAIAKFEQTGDYKAAGLAAVPVFVSNDVEKEIADTLARRGYTEYFYADNITGLSNGKNVTIQVEIGGLTPKTEYTVYVRNVSAQRTVLDKDGNKKTVELSSNGVPRDFKTTLGQVKLLQVKVDEEQDSSKLAFLQVHDAEENDYSVSAVRYYEYDLASAAGTQLSAWGAFSAIEAEDPKEADVVDYSEHYYRLPLTDATLKAKLLDPKLEYRMYQLTQDSAGIWKYATHDYYDETNRDWVGAEHYYNYGDINCLYGAKYTKADNKGALKFAQPEALAITAYDTVTKTESAPIIVYIKGAADSAAGKKVTLQVGQTTPITDLVAYKAGKTVLDSANPYFAHSATAASNDYLKVDEYGNITPVKFDKAGANQTVTVTGTPSVTGAATVTIKDLDPVKNLKFNNLIDNSFVLDFAPSIYAEGYIVDIKNASGSLVQRKYISQYDENLKYNDGFIWYYSTAKKGYVLADEGYRARFKVTGLKARCKYNVTITAVYGDAASKPVSKAITTTKIPAYDVAWNEDDNYDPATQTGGMGIWVYPSYNDVSDQTFVSGNRYTLVADANQGSQYAVTDKLTWSTSDGKVAKVSAVGGTYSASIKALKAGTTVIEVKSGILKQTIARWKITVRSVGDAYNNAYFYDEDEDLRGDGTDGYDTEKLLVLNVPTAVELAAGESKTFTFVAEEARRTTYRVVASAGMSATVTPESSFSLSKGSMQTVIVTAGNEPASGTITVEKVPGTDSTERTPLKLNETVKVPAYGMAVFTADGDADKLYRFSGSADMLLYKNINQSYTKSGSSIDYAIKKKVTVYVKNNSDSYNEIKVTPVAMSELKVGETNSVKNDGAYWYTFTASEEDDYRFKGDNTDYSRSYISLYKKIDDINTNNATNSLTVHLKAQETVYVRVNAWSNTSSFKVTKVEPVVITDDKTVYTNAVEAYDTTSFSITPTADAIYTFKLDSSVNKMSLELQNGTEVKSDTWTSGISHLLKAGTAYSLKVTNDYSSSTRTLTVEKDQISALVLDATEGKKFTTNSVISYGYLTFTVPADGEGTYKFEVDNLSSSTTLYIMAEPSENTNENIMESSVSSYNKTVECYLSAGKKVWLQMSRYYASNATVTVKKTGGVLQELPADKKVIVSAGETAWYSYKITESGRYSFDRDSYAMTVSYYEAMDKQDSTNSERYWKSGSTVYLKVTNSSMAQAETTFTVTKTNTEPWTTAIPASKTIPVGETKWYAFTPTDEGEIKFEAKDKDNNPVSIYLYTAKQFESKSYLGGSSSSSILYPFAKGETVYIKVEQYSYSEVTLTAEKAEILEIYEGEPSVETVNNDTLVKFTASETGIYTFAQSKSNGNTARLYLYDKESYANNSYLQSTLLGGALCYPLTKGTTVYIRISNYYANEFGFTVSRDKTVEMEEVTLGKETSLTMTSGEKKWIYFKVTDTEQYSYRITGSADSYNYLECHYANLTNRNWLSNMDDSWSSLYVGGGYENDYTFVYNDGQRQVVYMYIKPNNDSNVKITINEEKK